MASELTIDLQKNVGEEFLVDLPLPPPPPPLATPVTVLSHDCAHMTGTHSWSTKLYVCVFVSPVLFL